MTNKNYYAVLGLDSSASIEVIKAVYRVLAKKYHPDTYSGNKDKGEKIFKKINEAYQVLSNPSKKEEYDKSREDTHKNANDYEASDYNDENQSDDFYDSEDKKKWEVACDIYPEIKDYRAMLRKININLSIAYVAHLLETKNFDKAEIIFQHYKENFLSRYFSSDKYIHEVILELIERNYRHIALEVNKTIQVVGNPSDAKRFMKKILSKYNLVYLQYTVDKFYSSDEIKQNLAFRLGRFLRRFFSK